jgi:hypothetical protein
MEWERRSKRLWVAEHEGRRFRIERAGVSRDSGTVVLSETDGLHRVIRKEPVDTPTKAKIIAERWAIENPDASTESAARTSRPPATNRATPIRRFGTGMQGRRV